MIGFSASKVGLPYKSIITLNSKIADYLSATGLPNPVGDENSISNITAKRTIARVLGFHTSFMEDRNLIERKTVYNECGEEISDSWPFFVGQNAIADYKTQSGKTESVGIPLHGFNKSITASTPTSTGDEKLFNNQESFWHTNLDPDTSAGIRTENDPVEPENDWRYDGSIFTDKVSDPDPATLREERHNKDKASGTKVNPSARISSTTPRKPSITSRTVNGTTPKHLKSGLTGKTSRLNTNKSLVCQPGIENDVLNSYPYIKGLPLIKGFEESITKATINAFVDIGYVDCSAATLDQATQSCPPTPYCCKLHMEAKAGQSEFDTSIKEIGTRKIAGKKTSSTLFVEREFAEDLLILSAKNIDGLYTGAYSFSITSSTGITSSLFQKIPGQLTNPKDTIFGQFEYLTSAKNIKDIDYSERYLLLEGRGSGVVKIKVKDEVGCEAILTIIVGPAKFGPCNFKSRHVDPLKITIQNHRGQASWPDILIASPANAGNIHNRPNAPPVAELGWAWDYNRDTTFSPENPMGNPFGPSVGDGGGNGSYDTIKLQLSVKVEGGRGPYTVSPLNNSVYVCRKPSDWNGGGVAPKGFHQPWTQDTAPPPKVDGANRFGLKLGFDYGGDQPHFESSAVQPGVDIGPLAGPWQDDYKLYANKPGDRCFFKVFDRLGCVKIMELKVPCSTEVIIPPANSDQRMWSLAASRRASLAEIYSAKYSNFLHLNIGLGETENASIKDIVKYVSAPIDEQHQTLGAILGGFLSYNLLNNYWRLTARDRRTVPSTGSQMWTTDGNGNQTNDAFRIPGLTHEIFTDKTIRFKIKPGDFYHGTEEGREAAAIARGDPAANNSIEEQATSGFGKNVLIQKSRDNGWNPANGLPVNNNRTTKDVNSTRIVSASKLGDKIKISAKNLGYATVNYFIDDGQGGCNLTLLIQSTKPEVIYGDFIQGHLFMDKPWTGTSDIDSCVLNQGNGNNVAFDGAGAYRIEEQFTRANQILANGIPTLVGYYDENLSLPIRGQGQGQINNQTYRQNLQKPLDQVPPFSPGVAPGTVVAIPLGISVPCGKGFYGIKIASRRFNYHEGNAVYVMDDQVGNQTDIGWFASIRFQQGGRLMTFPLVPTLEHRERMATGWEFEIYNNFGDPAGSNSNTYKYKRSISGAGAWGAAEEMYPYRHNDGAWRGHPVMAWGRAAHQLRTPTNPFIQAQNSWWGHGYAGMLWDPFFDDSHTNGWPTTAQGNIVVNKAYDIITGPFRITDFPNVTGDINQPMGEFVDDNIRLTSTWCPFAETRRPPDEVSDQHLSGYGWRWPRDGDGTHSGGSFPLINATADPLFDSPSAVQQLNYTNPEFQCGTFIAAANPPELNGVGQGQTRSVEALDSGCDKDPVDNIIISNVTEIGFTFLNSLIGKWIRITWKPGYNDNTLAPTEVAPAPHATMEAWEADDPENYDEALSKELTKCYKIMYLENSEEFNTLRANRQTSDGQDGFHERSIGRYDANLKEDIYEAYTSCEDCAEEVVATSCDGSIEAIVRYPDFRDLPDDAVIFNGDSWQLNYRILDEPQNDVSLKNCFSFEKKNPYTELSSDEHGTNTGGTKLDEIEIQAFAAQNAKKISTQKEEAKKSSASASISPQRFIKLLSSSSINQSSTAGQYEVCDTVDIGYGEQELCTKGVDCADCEKSTEVVDITYNPEENSLDSGGTKECPGGPYKLETTPALDSPCSEISTAIDPLSSWPTAPIFKIDVFFKNSKKDRITVEIRDVVKPDHILELEKILNWPSVLPFYVEVNIPGQPQYTNTAVIDLDGAPTWENDFPIDVDDFPETPLDRDFPAYVSVYFAGLSACIKQIRFDVQCDVMYKSTTYDFNREAGEQGNCPQQAGCPSCDEYYPDILENYPQVSKLYRHSAIILETKAKSMAYVFDEDFFFIKKQRLTPNESEAIFIDDVKIINQEVYEVANLGARILNDEDDPNHSLNFKYTKHYDWDKDGCYGPSDGRSSPKKPTLPIDLGGDDTITEEGFPADSSQFYTTQKTGSVPSLTPTSTAIDPEECKQVKISGRCGFLVIKNNEPDCEPRKTNVEFFYWCKTYDGIRGVGPNQMSLTKLTRTARQGGAIIFGSEEEDNYSPSRERESKNITISKPLTQAQKVIEEFIPSFMERQITDPQSGDPIMFGHSQLGNTTYESPEGSLGEASQEDISKFLNQVKLKYTNPKNQTSPFSVDMKDFTWTSPLQSGGFEAGMNIEIISEEKYNEVTLVDITTSDIKTENGTTTADRQLSITNNSENTYIIEGSMNPEFVKNFKLCGETDPLPIQVEALTIASRKHFNNKTGNSKFFIIPAGTTAKINFLDEKILNNDSLQDGTDYAANFFFRIVGGFYRNEIKDSTTYLTTFDETLTSASFDLWAILPTAQSNKKFYQGTNPKGLISIPENKKYNITWNGQQYKLINVFTALKSDTVISSLTIS
jgi:hypothetical protein